MSLRLLSPRRAATRTRAALVALVVALLTLGGATSASAFWTLTVVDGSGSYALASASSLTPPSAASAVQSSATSVQVSWTPPGAQLAGAGYTVTRATGPGSPSVVCSAVSTTSCTDSGLTPGASYTWSVTAVIGQNWRSSAVTAGATLLAVTTTSLAGGNVGSAYSQALTAVGGTGAYTWSLTAGTLPTGLTLAPTTGVISGTPLVGGTTNGLQFTVTDGAGRTATSGSLTLVIGRTSQTITVSTAPANPPAGTTWTPTATATSGLPVTISIDSSTSANCSVSPSGVITFLFVPTCVVNFDQAGDGSYAAAPRVQRTITVVQGSQTISFTAPSDAGVGGVGVPLAVSTTAPPPMTVTLTSSTLAVCTVTGVTVNYLSAGTCTITASQAGNSSYAAAIPQTRTWLVRTPVGLGVEIVSGTGLPVVNCTGASVTATRNCTISGTDLSGSAVINVVVLSSTGFRTVLSYSTDTVANQTGQEVGTATILRGTSITSTTLLASHVGNAPKTSTITVAGFTLNLTVVT